MAFPLHMPIPIIFRRLQVEEAVRCQTTRTNVDMRQVFVILRGLLSPSLTLGNWETFYQYPYTPGPLMWFKCQKFGHDHAACTG